MIEVEGLSVKIASSQVRLVDDVSFTARRGEIIGLVGESGCGKSTVIKALLGMLPKGFERAATKLQVGGYDLKALSAKQMHREIRGIVMGYVPQDPYLALNPLFTIGFQLQEVGRKWGLSYRHPSFRSRVLAVLEQMQFDEPEAILKRYPHELSGGQRQRVLIAAALIPRPEVILADEPTTALDVITQQEIALLIKDLAGREGTTIIFVSHDLALVSEISDRIAVMYAGQTVEYGTTQDVLETPRHPYTQALLQCQPGQGSGLVSIQGEVPDISRPLSGCRFLPRCDQAMDACQSYVRRPEQASLSSRYAACLLGG